MYLYISLTFQSHSLLELVSIAHVHCIICVYTLYVYLCMYFSHEQCTVPLYACMHCVYTCTCTHVYVYTCMHLHCVCENCTVFSLSDKISEETFLSEKKSCFHLHSQYKCTHVHMYMYYYQLPSFSTLLTTIQYRCIFHFIIVFIIACIIHVFLSLLKCIIHVYICTYNIHCACRCIPSRLLLHTYMYMQLQACSRICTCIIYIHVHVCIEVCMHVLYLCIYIHVHVHVFIFC